MLAFVQQEDWSGVGPLRWIRDGKESRLVFEEVAEGYCRSCGHVHDSDHSCEDHPCLQSEQQNGREFLHAAGSYRKRKR